MNGLNDIKECREEDELSLELRYRAQKHCGGEASELRVACVLRIVRIVVPPRIILHYTIGHVFVACCNSLLDIAYSPFLQCPPTHQRSNNINGSAFSQDLRDEMEEEIGRN
ncbi:unnamed protein product [Rhizophagus irregularis]|nr:unnamed protein product [Rhizophagus irregularis]